MKIKSIMAQIDSVYKCLLTFKGSNTEIRVRTSFNDFFSWELEHFMPERFFPYGLTHTYDEKDCRDVVKHIVEKYGEPIITEFPPKHTLNELKYLKAKSIEMWTWLWLHPRRTKEGYFRSHSKALKQMMDYCLFCDLYRKRDLEKYCPVNELLGNCFHTGSVFRDWVHGITEPNSIDLETQKENARQILECFIGWDEETFYLQYIV